MPRTHKPNAYRIEGNVAYITLTQGKETIVDAEDVEDIIAVCRWCAVRTYRDTFYCVGTRPGYKHLYLHRFVLGILDTKDYADHINGDALDNRKTNLRAATAQQNAQNKTRLDPRSTTGVRGVTTHTDAFGTKRYVAKIAVYKYFPFTDEGYQQAVNEAIELRRKLKACGLM